MSALAWLMLTVAGTAVGSVAYLVGEHHGVRAGEARARRRRRLWRELDDVWLDEHRIDP